MFSDLNLSKAAASCVLVKIGCYKEMTALQSWTVVFSAVLVLFGAREAGCHVAWV